jgi:hypothetical protein
MTKMAGAGHRIDESGSCARQPSILHEFKEKRGDLPLKHLVNPRPAIAAALATIIATPSAWADTSVQFGTGFEYASGEFGATEDTTIYEVPFTVRLKSGNWTFRANVPLAAVDGPGGVIPGDDNGGERDNSGRGGGGNDDDDDDPTVIPGIDEMGLADVTLSGTYTFNLSDSVYLDATGKATLPTGDEEKDLGTGETDVAFLAELGVDTDAGGLYAQGGYKQRGGATREDGAQALFGGYTRLGEGVLLGADVSWAEAVIAGGDDLSSVTAYTSFRLTDAVRLSLFAEKGLSDASADLAAGVGITWRTNFRRPFERR